MSEKAKETLKFQFDKRLRLNLGPVRYQQLWTNLGQVKDVLMSPCRSQSTERLESGYKALGLA